jgi:two-component system response regulator MprA
VQTKRVLVVEDEDVIRTTLAEALQDEGYHVATASNGAEALQLVRATEPDAIVLDLMMPVMDGRAFLAACRREQRCAETPVLVLSAHHKLAELAAVELQVDDFIAKPFQLDAVLEAVERLVG